MSVTQLLKLPPSPHQEAERQGDTQTYRCGHFDITLPADHKLPQYQAEHRLYDRFLPALAQCLPDGALVIDVGANVGDTYASMLAANPSLDFICIEPSDVFFPFLTSNLAKLQWESGRVDRDAILKLYIGTPVSEGREMVAKDGSARAIASKQASALSYTPLQDILHFEQLPPQRCVLIKSDVDGFDHEVIASLGPTLSRPHTLLYFEAQCFTSVQLNGYTQLLHRLHGLGFLFTVFDNFGHILHENCQAHQVIELLNYAWAQEIGRSTRTIWYFDLLATTSTSHEIGQHACRAYRERFALT